MLDNEHHERSASRSRVSRPTTPLRPSSRSSFRDSVRAGARGNASFPLNIFEPHFAEFSDAMADLEANLMHFQLMHESLARFSESFAGFMYGLNMNAFCVDFPEGPIPESFNRPQEVQINIPGTPRVLKRKTPEPDDDSLMSPDGAFIENPISTKASRIAPAEAQGGRGSGRGLTLASKGGTTRGARGINRGSSIMTHGGAASRGSFRGRNSGLSAPRVRRGR